MIDPIVHCQYNLGVKAFEIPVEIYAGMRFCDYKPGFKGFKVFWVNEPYEIQPEPYHHARAYGDQYDFILTWDQGLLDDLPNARFFRNDICWVSPHYVHNDKIFGVSTVVGGKRMAEGHQVRHQLWKRRNEINTPKAFYESSAGGTNLGGNDGLVLGHLKDPLFDYQFHIVIENVRSLNMISEKLNDAIRTKTIPIYWGCPNVEATYDPRGIIYCETVDDIINACNNIDTRMYDRMLPFVEANYQNSLGSFPGPGPKLSETIGALINTMYKDGINIL